MIKAILNHVKLKSCSHFRVSDFVYKNGYNDIFLIKMKNYFYKLM